MRSELHEAVAKGRAGDHEVLDALVAAARAGDRDAMEALLLALAPQIERFGRRFCGPGGADLDDTLQDALLAVSRNLSGFEGRSALSSWVYTVVRSACSHRRRGLKNQPSERLDERVPDAGASPEDRTAAAERARAVDRALDALSDEHRDVIVLRDVEGLSAEEAAAALGLGVPALKSRLHRARAALRALLAPTFAPDSIAANASCPDVLAAFSQKLEDDLPSEACKLLQRHVDGCPACGAICQTLRTALNVCRTMGQEGPTPERERQLRELVRGTLAA